MKKIWKIIDIALETIMFIGAGIRILTQNGEWWDYLCLCGIPLIIIDQIRNHNKRK